MARPGAELAKLARERVKAFIERHGPEFIYVDWSAGKDSTAALAAAMDCCPGMVTATFLHLLGQTHADNAAAALAVARRYGMGVARYTGLRTPGELRRALERDAGWRRRPSLLYVVTRAPRGLDYWSATLRYGIEVPLERAGRGKRWACHHMKSRWLAARPPSGVYGGRPARFVLTGIRREESPYRARQWRSLERVFEARGGREAEVVLAPVADLSEEEVWELLRFHGLEELVRPQYLRWTRAPNCVICPMMGRAALRRAVGNLPRGYLERVASVLRGLRGRYREGTRSRELVEEMLGAVEEALRAKP